MARRFGTEHHEVLIDEADMLAFLPDLARHQDEPAADWTAVSQHFVSRLARDTGTIVIQCGEGADELLHGYDGYVAHRRLAVPFQRLPRHVRGPLSSVVESATRRTGRGIRHGEALYDAGHSPIPYWGGDLCFRGATKKQVLDRRQDHDPYRDVQRHWAAAAQCRPEPDLFQRITYLELQQRLPELLLMRLDKLTMASSVEGREPFLDHRLVEFALALPPRLKCRDGVGNGRFDGPCAASCPTRSSTAESRGSAHRWRNGSGSVRSCRASGRPGLPPVPAWPPRLRAGRSLVRGTPSRTG